MINFNRLAIIALAAPACLAVLSASQHELAPEALTASNARTSATITLRQLDEMRRLTVIADEDDSGFDFNKPGLVLTFDLAIPEGLNVHDVQQPRRVSAADNLGTDLTGIEEGFHGEREYVELVQSWGDPPTGFIVRLLPSARGAMNFNLKTSFDLVVYGGTEALTVQPSDQWQEIDPALFPSDKVEARLSGDSFGGDTAQFSVRPGSARDAIHEVYLIDGDDEVKSMSVMWSGESAHYGFDHPYRDGQSVRVVVRTNVHALPIDIELNEQILP